MPDNSHLLIALAASPSPGCQPVLDALQLPHLERLLARLTPEAPDTGSDTDFSPPHERALARHLGLPASPRGTTPWAAFAQQAAPGEAWAYVTPCQWHIGADSVTLADPALLQLTEADARALLDILAPWFAQDGIALEYDQPTRWCARGDALAGLACASLDRVVGRDVRPWLPDAASARLVHRLHSEMQMLLYTHPFNDERAARGLPAVNAFWLHGAGALPERPAPVAPPQQPDELRQAALAEDWAAWGAAWRALDAGPVAQLAARAAAGEAVRLTLCGERSALTWHSAPRGLWQRMTSQFRRQPLSTLAEQL